MEERYWIAVAAETGSGRLPRGERGAARARVAVVARRRVDGETMVALLVWEWCWRGKCCKIG
jgi:hypothetical protein